MKTVLPYLIQVIACSGIFYSYYHFFLRNKRFHQYNRFYLLAATLLSIVIPFLNIPFYFRDAETVPAVLYDTYSIISSSLQEQQNFEEVRPASPGIYWSSLLITIYIAIAAIILLRIVIAVTRIVRLLRQNHGEKIDQIYFVNTNAAGTPFSFFRWLFWNREISLQSERGQKMFRHELFHINQKHSWDTMYLEMLSVVFWFNPFFHIIRKEMKAVHEFLADEHAAKDSDSWKYAELLLMQVLGTKHFLLTNPFFHNQIKRRIAMITTSQKPGYQYFRKIMVLPLLAIVFALFAFKLNKLNSPLHKTAEKSITVVIDAGHGLKADGRGDGAIADDGTLEDQLTLAIAKKIGELSSNRNINLVFTRETESLVALKDRTTVAVNEKADIFISLHVAASPKSEANGIDVYIGKNEEHNEKSTLLANLLLNSLSDVYTINPQIKRRQVSIWVLEKTPCPSVLIECGYITNSRDLAFMKESANQEKIAKSILNAIEVYAQKRENAGTQKTNADPPVLIQRILAKTNQHPEKRVPDAGQLKKWSDEKIFGVWVDGKRIKSQELQQFVATDFSYYVVSKLEKNAVNYGKHYYQVNLMTDRFYDVEISQKLNTYSDASSYNKALIVIDGKPREDLRYETLDQKIEADEITFINVLKGKAAVDKYGEKGENGVLEIFMKKAKQ